MEVNTGHSPYQAGDLVYVFYRNPHTQDVANIQQAAVVHYPENPEELALFLYRYQTKLLYMPAGMRQNNPMTNILVICKVDVHDQTIYAPTCLLRTECSGLPAWKKAQGKIRENGCRNPLYNLP
jgi:hypothetical protein